MPNFLQEDYGVRNSIADTAAPGSGSWNAMDMVVNTAPAVATPVSWVCVTGGSPGTWKSTGPLQDVATVTTVTAAANVPVASNIVLVTGSGAHNVTLAAPAAANSGTVLNFVNTSSGTITAVAASGTQVVGVATSATNTSANFKSSGTSWYRV